MLQTNNAGVCSQYLATLGLTLPMVCVLSQSTLLRLQVALQGHTYDSLGDCVVDPGTYTECNYCDYVGKFKTGDAPGHDFTHVEADPGHCEADGHAEYWECSVCDKMFATDDKMAPMDTAVTLDDLNTGLGTHLKKTDENGVVVEYNENGHWYICAIDGGRIDFNCGVLADDEVVKHDFENAKCTECGYECVDHQFKDTGKIAVIGIIITARRPNMNGNFMLHRQFEHVRR